MTETVLIIIGIAVLLIVHWYLSTHAIVGGIAKFISGLTKKEKSDDK